MCHHLLQIRTNFDLRERIGKSHSFEEFRDCVLQLKERFLKYHTGEETFEMPEEIQIFNLKLPPWLCQPYVRPPPDVYLEKMRKLKEVQQVEQRKAQEAERQLRERLEQETGKRTSSEGDHGENLSKRQLKKLKKQEMRALTKTTEGGVRLCDGEGCGNPCSLKCHHFMCRQCCRAKSRAEILDCPTHKMFKKTLTERAKQKEAEEKHGVEGGGGGAGDEIVIRTEA
jgi:tRNA-dihydrouridine synthase 1